MDLEDALNSVVGNVDRLANMNQADQREINWAGAEAFANDLRAVTNAKHRSTHNDEKYGHAADHISISTKLAGKSTNTLFGAVGAGWDNRYHAENMRRLNDGTVYITPDHFITNLQNDPTTATHVVEHESPILKRLVKKYEKGEA